PAGGIVCGAGGSRTYSLQVTSVPPRSLIDGLYNPLDGPAAESDVVGTNQSGPTTPFGGDDNLYAGIWRAGTYPYASWFTTSWQEFTTKWGQFQSAGLRMHDFETFLVGSTRVYAGIFNPGNDAAAA